MTDRRSPAKAKRERSSDDLPLAERDDGDGRIFELIERWETQLDLGIELSPEELAAGDARLAAELRRWIEPLRATRWVRPAVADPRLAGAVHSSHGTEETVDPRTRETRLIRAPKASQNSTCKQFLLRLEASGVLSAADLQSAQDDASAANGPALAAALVYRGLLTEFQAESLLRGEFTCLVLGNYVILRPLGSGGMGDVFLARHRVMDRLVALKTLPSSANRRPDAVERFHREVRALARLSHPNIVAAHDADHDRGLHFLVMEYVPGEDLASLVERTGPLPWQLAVECIRQTAEGLAYAHAHGILHRDVKPSNLMVVHSRDQWSRVDALQGVPLSPAPSPQPPAPLLKLLDLGLSRAVEEMAGGQEELTRTGAILGTADFMAPEQSFDSTHVDHRADIYALGCTIYFLLTGRPVFPGSTVGEKLLAHRNDPPDLSGAGFQPALVSEGSEVRVRGSGNGDSLSTNHHSSRTPASDHSAIRNPQSALASLLSSLLAKSPADRPQSMAAVAAALAAIQSGAGFQPALERGRREPPKTALGRVPELANPKSKIARPKSLNRRHLLSAALATAAASAAGFGTFTIWKRLAYGTVHLQLPTTGVKAAEILVDHKPVDRRQLRIDGSQVELSLPIGQREIRILADAHYPSIHQVEVPFRGNVSLAASFAPAFRWRFTGDKHRLGCIEAAEDNWIGWNLDIRNGRRTRREVSVVRELPPYWDLSGQLYRAGILFDGARPLSCDSTFVLKGFERCCLESGPNGSFCWRLHRLPDGCLAIEYVVHPSERGLYLTTNSAAPRIVKSAEGRDNFDANPVGVRTQPPPADLVHPSTEPVAFWRRSVHIIVALGQVGAGLYLSIDEHTPTQQRHKAQLAHAVLLTAGPTTEWDIVPDPGGHTVRVASGKFKDWWLNPDGWERRNEQDEAPFAKAMTFVAWNERAQWDIKPAGDNAYTIQVIDKYFGGWRLASPPSEPASAADIRPGLALNQPTHWEFREA